MLVDYRKVFVRDSEVILTRSDFEILQLLLSQAGRVFTYEQLYQIAYGEDVAADVPINAVRCHMEAMHRKKGYDGDAMYDATRNIMLGQGVNIPYPDKYWTAEVLPKGYDNFSTAYMFSAEY